MIRALPPSLRQTLWCLALAIAMLATQFAGQAHRIGHARWLNGPAPLQAQAAGADRQWSGLADISHSCVALDAISLASGVAGAIALLLPDAVANGRVAVHARRPWHNTSRIPFLSRAPPRTRY